MIGTALISLSPIILLFLLMLVIKLPAHISGIITFVVAIAIGIFVAPELDLVSVDTSVAAVIAGYSSIEGALKAIFPILLIIIAALFSYNLLLESGAIETIKRQFTGITSDRSLLVLLIVWGFGGVLEGMAGFGTPVAIPAAILISLGYKPVFSALVALLGNTVATGFGSAGVPIITLCSEISSAPTPSIETLEAVSSDVIIQLAPLFVVIPFAILMLTDRSRIRRNILLSIWVGGVSWGVQYASSIWLGVSTPAIIGSIAAIIAIIAWIAVTERSKMNSQMTLQEGLSAWSIYIAILVCILLTGPLFPTWEHFLKTHLVSTINLPVINSGFSFAWVGNTAFPVFAGCLIGALIQGISLRRQVVAMAHTLYSMRFSALTIISLIAMASVMNHCGMIRNIADMMIYASGSMYPLFAPMIGCLGTFVTGSDTSSNILFGKLQSNMAALLGYDTASSHWLSAANTTGATAGKMISPQSIAIATAACNIKNAENTLLLKALPYALLYIIITGVIVYIGV